MGENKKLTLLESYRLQKDCAVDVMKKSQPTAQHVWYFQELLYRINTLEVFQTFLAAAPSSVDPKDLIPHYQFFEAYVLCLMNERKLGGAVDAERQKQQKTAFENLQLIFNENKKKFSHYAPRSPEQYHKDVGNFSSTVLPVWIQYRNTLIEIKTKETKQ